MVQQHCLVWISLDTYNNILSFSLSVMFHAVVCTWLHCHKTPLHYALHMLNCCSVTCRPKSLKRCSRWHVLNSIVFPSGSETMRRWGSVCGVAMRRDVWVWLVWSTDTTTTSQQHRDGCQYYGHLASADILHLSHPSHSSALCQTCNSSGYSTS